MVTIHYIMIGPMLKMALTLAAHSSQAKASSSSSSSLDQARALQTPSVDATQGGEFEHLEFWQTHESLFQNAWVEWEELQQQTNNTLLPDLSEKSVMDPGFAKQINQLWESPSLSKEKMLKKDFWYEPIPGVYVCQSFFSRDGIEHIRQHLKAASESGIPTRRPNGMNRYGLVLDNETQGGVSYSELDGFRTWLVDHYIRPLARMFFPDYIGSFEDDESSYAFTIHYKEPTADSGDVQLKEHSDASVVTVNINLNLPQDGEYQGSELVFLDKATQHRHKLELKPGMVVLHRGIHRHQALPIETGERHQLIVWLFGRDGYVRFAPYKKNEQLSIEKRWSSKPSSDNREHFEL